jgi:hypothetical protein
MTWLHHLHLGVAMMEKEAFDEARVHFTSSIALKENAPALRCLALLDERDGHPDAALTSYQSAWPLCGNDPNLAVEICAFFLRHQRHAAFAGFVKSLPESIAEHERIVLMTAQIALADGRYADTRRLLGREFATIREGEVSLSELWFASYLKEAGQRQGRQLTEAETRELQEKFPPPRQMDFRMK